MAAEPEVQGPPFPIWVVNRRNGIQGEDKIRWIKPKKIKLKTKKKAAA